jgi:hypothetical protein
MRASWRKLLILTMIGALAAANCYGVPASAAPHHGKSSVITQASDQSAHDHAALTHNHSTGSDSAAHAHGDGKSGAKTLSETCCASMTCSATGILGSPEVSPMRLATKFVSVILYDELRTVSLGTIDPPPRTI